MTRSSRILAALLAFGTVAIFAVVLVAGHRVVPDDVFFYLEIADRIVAGEGSTFNGLQQTNGYHPLWMGVQVGLRALVGADPDMRIGALFIATALGNLAAIALAWRLSRRLGISLMLAPVLIAAYASMNHLGSEFHVSLPLLLASLLAAVRIVSTSQTGQTGQTGQTAARPLVWLGFGALLGATALARLDNVFCVAALGLVVLALHHGSRADRVRAVLLLGLGGLVVLGPYFAWNLSTFGHLVPVSGAVKGGLASVVAADPIKMGAQGLVLFAIGVIAPLYLWQRARRRRHTAKGHADLAVFAFSLGALAHGLYVLFRLESIWTWYFATELVTASLTLAMVLDRLVSRRERLSRAARVALPLVTVALLGVVFAKYLAVTRTEPTRWYQEAAAWIDREVPASGAVATTNSPGGMAFYAQRPILAIDGLTGDFAWHTRAAEIGLYETLRELGVTHVISMGADAPVIAPWIERTRAIGHGGEGPTFDGAILPDGTVRLRAVGMFSGIVGRQVGWLATAPDTELSRCPCGFSMWWLVPAPDVTP